MPSQQMESPTGATQPEDDIAGALRHVSVLVVDDDAGARAFVSRTLSPYCRRIEEAADTETADDILAARHFDLVMLDNVMPGRSGLDWLADMRRRGLFAEVIVISAYADLETSIHALRSGAADLLPKPLRSAQIVGAAARCMDRRHQRYEAFRAGRRTTTADKSLTRDRLIGASPQISRIRDTLERVAPLATPVLVIGESGAGKEIAARSLHQMSRRAGRPFVPVSCAGLSQERIAAELFGDAGDGSAGLLQHAAGGTLFLDEVSELPLPVQAMLLRVIEEGRVRPRGADHEIPLDLRFVLATSADLTREVAGGRFRADLFHRINVLTVTMPPLRDRVGDIADLAAAFMEVHARQLGLRPLPLTDEVVVALARHDWPGNVRELRNLIERSLILGAFPPDLVRDDVAPQEPTEALHAVEKRHILSVLEACGGNRAEAARRLGVSRKTIDRKCAMWKL